jgi:8-amino-7-oxononanoate synthase
MRSAESELLALEETSLRRHLYEVASQQGALLSVNGKSLVNFSSNDYLGLANHPKLIKVAQESASKWGVGSGASRLISGSLSPHVRLEERLSELKQKPAARVFANGYASSLGLISAVVSKNDVVILDKLSHASLIDGARLSGALIRVFPHNDLPKLEALLQRYQAHNGRVLVVTESVFSMDGDLAPVEALVGLKKKYPFLLLLDEAHGLGVCGSLGLAHHLGLNNEIDFHMGTLGKAVGVAGGYVACDHNWAELLTNKARSFIYSTAPPPAQCETALEGLNLIVSTEGEELRTKLWNNIHRLASKLSMKTPASAIVPLLVGDSQEALNLAESLKKAGFLVPAVRYPTVPKNTARLRITLSASHSSEQIDTFVQNLQVFHHLK